MTEKELYTPTWIKWYCDLYTDGIKGFDAEQIGWYQLLLHAAMRSTSPELGFLEDDDDMLREIAKVKDLLAIAQRLLKQNLTITQEQADSVALYNAKRWSKVLAKFRKSSEHPGFIYNQRLTKVLKEAYNRAQMRSEVGNLGVARRRELKEIRANAQANGEPNAEQMLKQKPTISLSKMELDIDKELNTKKQRDNTTLSKKLDERSWMEPDWALTEDQGDKILQLATRLLQELNWSSSAVENKVQQCQTEFVEYWLERKRIDKSTNRVAGKKSSWYMAFRKRIEMMCSFELRQDLTQRGKQNNVQKKFESAGERNARLWREQDKLYRDDPEELQGSSQEHNQQHTPGLPLTTDGD